MSIEVWDDSATVQFDPGETIWSMNLIQSDILNNCKKYLDYGIGTRIKAIDQNGSTVGLGTITKVTIGKVYKGIQPLYGSEDEPALHPTFVAPCIYTASIQNLRRANFYHFFIGNAATEEYDSKYLQSKKWKLALVISNFNCYNYEELNLPRGCSD